MITARRLPNLLWIGMLAAGLYWLIESAMHTFIFSGSPFFSNLFGAGDTNELQMRIITSVLFVAFGWLAERFIRSERRMKDDAQHLHSLLGVVDRAKHCGQAESSPTRSLVPATESPPPSLPRDGDGGQAPERDIDAMEAEIENLTQKLQELSSILDLRFKELYALLELTREINLGILLDEVLERAYTKLRSVIPFHRLGVALIDIDGRTVRARWAMSDQPLMLTKGYSAPLAGSSLESIVSSGEPRILNDLTEYLDTHPGSESTRLIVNEGIRSSLTCPLIAVGKPIGFMFFSSRLLNEYKAVHVDMFRLVAGHLSVVVEKSNLYQQILEEKEKSEALLLNVMPARVATRLRAGERTIAESFSDTCVFFADIVSFTTFAGRYTPELVVGVLQALFTRFDRLCDEYGVEKIKTIGDGYMAVCNSVDDQPDGNLRTVANFALALIHAARELRHPDGQPLELRVGVHAGPVVAGVIGQRKFAYDIWGDTVNVASRMESTGEPGRVQVSEAVFTRLRKEFDFERRGEIRIKGKDPMVTYFLLSRKPKPE